MIIHDYYLSRLIVTDIKNFEDWKKENQNKIERKNEQEKCNLWLEEIFMLPLAKQKKNDKEKLAENKNINCFYPSENDIQNLPQNTTLLKISFTLKKPYTSKDEEEFRILNGKITENPIARDKFTGLPMVKPSTWKGHLRFAAGKVKGENEKKKRIIKRIFGSESEEKENQLKGRLYFFPTFFKDNAERDVITPLKRDTRTPPKGKAPINLEVMKPGKSADFYLLYFPYPKGDNFKEDEAAEDLNFLADALRLMFYTYGFSAKKTSGFGVIEEKLEEGKLWIKKDRDIEVTDFSNLEDLNKKIEELKLKP
ncbi:MAG: hypothetical protein KBG25_00665 [Paludibacteraceae bacterium]|nr:hypothetical protein [Paludibacteraceae bacterium]